MPLETENWNRVEYPEVIWAFLKAETQKAGISADDPLVASPKLADSAENERRLRLLHKLRFKILDAIPRHTLWYKVTSLREEHLPQLCFIGSADRWNVLDDVNEFELVAKRMDGPLLANPSDWQPTILWGHTKAGPFTIIEGNNRFLGLACQNPRPEVELETYVGLSPDWFHWHRPEQPRGWVKHGSG